MLALSQALLERHDGQVPADRAALEALPGVGRKTANVVLNEAFGEPTIAVDTHVFRVANRTGLAPGKTPEAVEATLERVVPAAFKHGAHHWLILHGRYVCIARRPACPTCVVREICLFADKTPARPRFAKPRRKAAATAQSRVVAADHAGGGQGAAGQPPLGRAHPPGQHALRLRQHRRRHRPDRRRDRAARPDRRRSQRRQTGEMDIAAAPVEPDGEAAGVARQPERPLVGAGHDVAEVVLPMRGVAP